MYLIDMDKVVDKEKVFFFSIGLLFSSFINWYNNRRGDVIHDSENNQEKKICKIKDDCDNVLKESKLFTDQLAINLSIIKQETQTISCLLTKLGDNLKTAKLQSQQLVIKEKELQEKELNLLKKIEINNKKEYINVERTDDVQLDDKDNLNNYDLMDEIILPVSTKNSEKQLNDEHTNPENILKEEQQIKCIQDW